MKTIDLENFKELDSLFYGKNYRLVLVLRTIDEFLISDQNAYFKPKSYLFKICSINAGWEILRIEFSYSKRWLRLGSSNRDHYQYFRLLEKD